MGILATYKDLILFTVAGLIEGVIYDFLGIFKSITKKNIIVVTVADFLSALVGGAILIYCIFKFEFGNFAFFEIIGFIVGIVFEQIFVKNLFASPIKYVYNKLNSRKLKKFLESTKGES